MNNINKQQAILIADLLESGHIHYELNNRNFLNAFSENGIFIEERDDRGNKERQITEYSREEFIDILMKSPQQRFSRFLSMMNSTNL